MAYSPEKDLFPFVGQDDDTDIILFFTDNKNEPRKINVRRSIEDDVTFSGNALNYTGATLKDFITACPKTPQSPIRFSWTKNPDFESNFRNTNGFQFAYQNVYVDGFISAISALSSVSYPTAIQNLGSESLSNVVVESECILEIPSQSEEVVQIRILFREGNDGPFKLMDSVSNQSDLNNPLFDFDGQGGVLGYYSFRNDSVYPIVPKSQVEKNFDNLPRRAKAQSVSGNRLMYGNYVDGFDPVPTSVVGTALFGNVDQNLSDIAGEIEAINIFAEIARDTSPNSMSNDRGESIGFSINVGTADIEPGTYRLSLDFAPEMGYHIYNGNSYFPSKNQTFNGESDYDFTGWQSDGGQADPDEAAISHRIFSDPTGNPQIQSNGPASTSGTKLLPGYMEGYAGAYYPPAVVNFDDDSSISGSSVGSTPANPLIIPKTPIFIDIVLEVTQTIPANTFMDAIIGVIDSGESGTPYVVPLSYTGQDLELGAQNNEFNFSNASGSLGVRSVLQPDLGLNSGDEFAANTSFADYITYIPEIANDVFSEQKKGDPVHFFIVNKADVLINVKSVPFYTDTGSSPYHGYGQPNPTSSTKRYFRFEICEVRNHELLTCLPEPVNGLGYTPIDNQACQTASLMPWESSGIFANGVNTYNSNVRWPRVKYQNVTFEPGDDFGSGTYVRSQNFPNGAALFDRNGELLELQDIFGQKDDGIPIAIGKWRVYTKMAMLNKEWQNDFRYEFIGNDFSLDGPVTFILGNFSQVLFPASRFWDGYLSYDDPAPDAAPLFQTNPNTNFYSFIDGKAGMGGRTSEGVDGYSSVSNSEVFYAKAPGDARVDVLTPLSDTQNSGEARPVSNRRGSIWNTTLVGIHDNFKYLRPDVTTGIGDTGAYRTPTAPLDSDIFAAPLQDLGSFIDIGVEGNVISSFKTRDFHDFGIVYFDERGRAGGVNILPSVYVPGYSNQERDSDEKGPVAIRYKINHLPPTWASSYKIVYAGAANTERFIQYASGGAFTEPNVIGDGNDKIYVSLNYLQNNRASYAKSYGASDQDTGEPTLYRFTPGDKLRIISYYTDDDTIEYAPKGYDFDIVGVEEVSQEQESPLIAETDQETDYLNNVEKFGSFLVLRNNLGANGFSASDVSSGADKWGDRCIFEIVTPRKERGEELKPYYETQVGGRIIGSGTNLQHEFGTAVIQEGDVYFRRVPVNLRPYNSSDESFTDIIGGDGSNETSQSRLRPYFLESSSVTDLFRSNSKSFGKPHFYIDGFAERVNDTSIIYSDPTNLESYNIFYTSFSPLVKNFFDLPAKYGDIDYMADAGDQIYTAQNSKIGKIQVDKSLTTTASASDTLNLSREVLNSARFYLEDVGTDGNPESVTWANNTLYFVDKSRGVVASAGEQGMQFISSAGMDKFFKRYFKKHGNQEVRVTTGYNPFSEELLVSFMKESNTNERVIETESLLEDPSKAYTFAYDLPTKSWVSSYTFFSSNYDNVGNTFISFKDVIPRASGLKDILWAHSGHKEALEVDKNNFYGVPYSSAFISVLNEDPNKTKDFKSISIDGTSPWNLNLKTDYQKTTLDDSRFTVYEDTFYQEIPRAESISNLAHEGNSSRYKTVGRVLDAYFDSQDASCLYVRINGKDISQYHITLSPPSESSMVSRVIYFNPLLIGSDAEPFVGTDSVEYVSVPNEVVENNLLKIKTLIPVPALQQAMYLSFLRGKYVIIESSARVFGDSMRGKLLETFAYTYPRNNIDEQELFSINVDYIDSKLNTSR